MSRRRCNCCNRGCGGYNNYPCGYNNSCQSNYGCGSPYNSIMGNNCFFNNPALIWILLLGNGRFFNC